MTAFNTIQGEIFEKYGEPSAAFNEAGTPTERLARVQASVDKIFNLNDKVIHNDPAISASNYNATVFEAFESVESEWRAFANEFISVNENGANDPLGNEDFEERYLNARHALASYREEDSVRGIVTFVMNRLVYAPKASTAVNAETLNKASKSDYLAFWNAFSNAGDSEETTQFNGYVDSFITERDELLLKEETLSAGGVTQTAMNFSKKVWKSA